MVTGRKTATEASHFSCSRSSPRARRKRSSRLTTPTMSTRSSTVSEIRWASVSASPQAAIPTGLSMVARLVASATIAPGRKIWEISSTAVAKAATPSTGAQRRDSSLPSGNTSSTAGMTPM